MRLPWSREKIPEYIRDAVDLTLGERVRAAVEIQDGGYAVATDMALHLLLAVPEADRQDLRIRWDLIDNVTWSPPTLVLELRRDRDAAPEQLALDMDQRADLPAVVRNRVTDSIVVNDKIEYGRSWIRIIARKIFETQEVEWRVVPGPGLDASAPDVADAIELHLHQARSQWEM